MIEYHTEKNIVVSIQEDKTNLVPGLHFHSSYEIYLTHSGPMSCLINDKIYPLRPNDMLVFSPSDIHMSTKPKNSKYISTVFNFSPDRINRLSDKIDLLLPFRASADNFSHKISLTPAQVYEYLHMLEKMKRLINSKNDFDDVRQQLLLAEILLFIHGLYEQNIGKKPFRRTNHDEIIFKLLMYINENVSGNLSLSHLSNKFFISKNILNKRFKQKTGYTLGQYVINYRMYCARQMLESGESVYNAAWKVGYQNASNFIRTYKKIIGNTPGTHRIIRM